MTGIQRFGLFGGGRFLILILGIVALLGMGVGFALSQAAPKAKADEHPGGASIVVNPTEVDFSSRASVWIYGAGLTPGTQVGILLLDSFGVQSDISYASEPFPAVVNDDGAFAVKWVLDRWTRPGVGAEGLFTLRVVDQDFNTLATAPIALCKASERKRALEAALAEAGDDKAKQDAAKAEAAKKVPAFCSK